MEAHGDHPSLPIRERGLKLVYSPIIAQAILVAPHTGAWIETYFPAEFLFQPVVAPHTGAWIETHWESAATLTRNGSLPIRERGLKLSASQIGRQKAGSLPIRERGLKPRYTVTTGGISLSLPIRERGLKR